MTYITLVLPKHPVALDRLLYLTSSARFKGSTTFMAEEFELEVPGTVRVAKSG